VFVRANIKVYWILERQKRGLESGRDNRFLSLYFEDLDLDLGLDEIGPSRGSTFNTF
jgi:hypothetical protein